MSDKYLKYHISTRKAGLRHQAYNLKTLIYESHALGRFPVITKWLLFGYHNFNREVNTDFTKYFDFGGVQIGGLPIKVLMNKDLPPQEDMQIFQITESIDSNVKMAIRQFPPSEGCSWKYIDTDFDIYHKVTIPYSKEVITLAGKLLQEIGSPFTVVHVRRRDVLKKKWRLWWDTRPKHIISVLDQIQSPKNVYVMSNELKSGFFNAIGKRYELTTLKNVPWLIEVQKEDNFLAFCVENQLLKMAHKKITTFSDNTDEEWDGFLSKAKW